MMSGPFHAPDFTEERYRELLDACAARFRFASLHDDAQGDGIAIWRHDVDMSPQRALRLARIEAERGVHAHYFIHPGSAFYNPFEPANRGIIREIAGLGHEVGLHFDAAATGSRTREEVEAELRREADIIGALLGRGIAGFSLHNPTVRPEANLEAPEHAGLVNASARALQDAFTYCSDSNGLWRFRPLHEVIADPEVTRLYALTHPVWWTPGAMPPREKIQRAIDGRALATASGYDQLLAAHGRPNAPLP